MISTGNGRPLRLQPFQKFDAVDAGHADVGDHASKVNAGERIEEMLGRFEQRDIEVCGAEQEVERIPHRLVIIDDIDLSSRRHLSNSRLMRQAV